MVIGPYFGCNKTNLICLSASKGKGGNAPDNLGGPKKPLGKSDVDPSSSLQSKKSEVKPRLLLSKVLWTVARVVAPGQNRTKSLVIKYQQSRVVFIIKLYTKSVCIDSLIEGDIDISSRSYPIPAEFRNIDLKSYYTRLLELKEWRIIRDDFQIKSGSLKSRDHPFTIQTLSLPFRLVGFKPLVLMQFQKDLDLIIEIEPKSKLKARTLGLKGVTCSSPTSGKGSYEVDGVTLSKTFTREIRPILNSISDSSLLPSAKVLNLIKYYLFILKTSVNSLNELLEAPTE